MIFLDGVYLPVNGAAPVFRQRLAPTAAERQVAVQQIAERIGKVLERRGLVEGGRENAWLAADSEAGPLDNLSATRSPTASR